MLPRYAWCMTSSKVEPAKCEPRTSTSSATTQRQAVCVEAKLLSPDMSRCIDCVIRDISEGGSLVSVRGETAAPPRVYLWQPTAEAMVECEVRWNKLNLIGLKFLEEGAQAKLLSPQSRRCLPPLPLHGFAPSRPPNGGPAPGWQGEDLQEPRQSFRMLQASRLMSRGRMHCLRSPPFRVQRKPPGSDRSFSPPRPQGAATVVRHWPSRYCPCWRSQSAPHSQGCRSPPCRPSSPSISRRSPSPISSPPSSSLASSTFCGSSGSCVDSGAGAGRAYLFTACLTAAHTLSFPGLFSATGLLGAGPQTTAWLYMFWHGGFPLFLIAYARSARAATASQPGRRFGRYSIPIGIASALTAALGCGCSPRRAMTRFRPSCRATATLRR